jgi:ureidoglycolate hydrolase
MHSIKSTNKLQNNQPDTLPDSIMDSLVQGSIRAQDLTDEAFAPYGDIIKPRMSGEQFDRTHSYDPSKEKTYVKLVMTNGVPTLRIMNLRLRGLTFSNMARHRRVSQCLGSLQGKEWYMAVAAPTNGDSCPRLEDIAAFRIPDDRIIKLHVGTWHAGPHFKHQECLFMNLENEDTNTQDFQDVALPHECQIKD